MPSITFDTLRYAEKLTAAGLTHESATAQARALQEAFTELVDVRDLATKKDLQELKYDLVKWIVGLALAQFSLLIGILLKIG